MAEKRDYYEVLGVARTATDKEIATSYRRLAVKYHPDSNAGNEDAVFHFKEAAEAYEVLSDAEKRARYDRFGHAGIDGQQGGSPHFSNLDDIFEAFGGIFGDIFGGGGGRRRSQGPRRGADVQCEVTIDFMEAARGVTKSVQFERSEVCAKCKGTGSKEGSVAQPCRRCGGQGRVVQQAGILRVQTTCPSCHGSGAIISDPCGECRGAGQRAKKVKIEVRIPGGVDDGTRIRVTGEGEPSPDGGRPGDCYCFIHVTPHPLFHRDGLHLIVQLPINFTQAALGAKIEVPTLDGPDELNIPPGTQPNEVFKLRGKGMPDVHGRGRGDLLVQTLIEVPKKLSRRQEELLREMAEEESADVTPHRKTFLEKLKEYFSGHKPAGK